MINSDNNITYNEDDILGMLAFPNDYISNSPKNPTLNGTDTGADTGFVMPSFSIKDDIFQELPEEVKSNNRVLPFLKALGQEYIIHKDTGFSFLPLMVGENNDDGVILDWIYETVSISFYFLKDKMMYSITRYDPTKKAFSQEVEPMQQDGYKKVAEKVMAEIE